MQYSLFELLYIFIVYSFIGWCVEVVYAATVRGQFINRGFCIGPVCPIYGVGVISVLIFLEPIKEDWWLLFLASMIFTSFIEFAGGFILEKFFHEKWWDYSKEPFNLKGYICLKFSILWGLACVLVVNVIHPTVMAIIYIIPKTLGNVLISVLMVTFASDLSITIINLLKLRNNITAIVEIQSKLKNLSESIGMNLSEKTLVFMEQSERLKEDLEENKNIERIKEAFEEKLTDMEEMRESFSDKREEFDALYEKLKLNLSLSRKRGHRIGAAFPNMKNGRYHHIFKN